MICFSVGDSVRLSDVAVRELGALKKWAGLVGVVERIGANQSSDMSLRVIYPSCGSLRRRASLYVKA